MLWKFDCWRISTIVNFGGNIYIVGIESLIQCWNLLQVISTFPELTMVALPFKIPTSVHAHTSNKVDERQSCLKGGTKGGFGRFRNRTCRGFGCSHLQIRWAVFSQSLVNACFYSYVVGILELPRASLQLGKKSRPSSPVTGKKFIRIISFKPLIILKGWFNLHQSL